MKRVVCYVPVKDSWSWSVYLGPKCLGSGSAKSREEAESRCARIESNVRFAAYAGGSIKF